MFSCPPRGAERCPDTSLCVLLGGPASPWLGLIPALASVLQKLDPFLSELHRASSLLQSSIEEFEKGDPPGGVQVSLGRGLGKPYHTSPLQTRLREGTAVVGSSIFVFHSCTWLTLVGHLLGQADSRLP